MWRRGTMLSGMLATVVACAARAASPSIAADESVVRLGLTGGYTGYEENIQPQDTESGALLGFDAGLSVLSPSGLSRFGWPDIYASATYQFSGGLLDYHGNLDGQGQNPYTARDHDFYNTVIVRLGFGRPITMAAELIPFAAGGYQSWNRNIQGNAGYGEFYQAGLMGGGLKLDLAASPLLVVSAVAEGFAVIGGSVSAPSQNFTAGFGASAEERVSLDADYRLSDAWHAFAGVGLTHYGYTGSKPGGEEVYEPLSTTFQVNSVFGFAYGF